MAWCRVLALMPVLARDTRGGGFLGAVAGLAWGSGWRGVAGCAKIECGGRARGLWAS